MKIIDLLNKIAKGEEVPKKIKFEEEIFDLIDYGKDIKIYQMIEEPYTRLDINTSCLNDEVKIIEEEKKIPEKIDQNNYQWKYGYKRKVDDDIQNNIEILRLKVNEILDYLDYLQSKGE